VTPPDPTSAREALDALIAAFAMLGGSIAYSSGLAASRAEEEGASGDGISRAIGEGVVIGFRLGVLLAPIALIIVLWS
jgi:hypothetical protein